MKVLFWVPYPREGASNRYRVDQYLPYLEKSGIEYAVHSFWDKASYSILYKKGRFLGKLFSFARGAALRLLDVLRIRKYDVVFIHREAMPIGGAMLESAIFFLGRPIVFDFDDAIFLPSSSRYNNFIEKLKNPNKVADIIRKSAYVIAGNDYLAEFARCYNDKVSVIPTSINIPAPAKDAAKTTDIVIGWIGSITTVDFLNGMKDVFKALVGRFPGIFIKIVGGDFDSSGIARVINEPWSIRTEEEQIRSFDIGIMPMPDNSWTKGKCAFKAILYMAHGIPCVCSPVGANNRIVKDGVNGFLAGTNEEWVEKLALLIKDPALRERMGAAGRDTIAKEYSVPVNAPKFLEVLMAAYAAGRGRG